MRLTGRFTKHIQIVDRTVIINPGYLSRGANPDSFAKIMVPSLGSVSVSVKTTVATADGAAADPATQEASSSEEERTDLPERIKVEIIKLE